LYHYTKRLLMYLTVRDVTNWSQNLINTKLAH
jgi:hypothetical protein